jgi:hypothetical protein
MIDMKEKEKEENRIVLDSMEAGSKIIYSTYVDYET